MADVERYATELIELIDLVQDVRTKFQTAAGGKWGIRQVVDSYLSMFDRFCPFAVGDRVALTKTLDISEDSGWYSCRHFLIEGAVGTITQRGYSDGQFQFYVTFDDETWIDRDDNEQPVDDKHVFSLSESVLKKATQT